MISLRSVSKQYRGVSVNNDSGVYLWIKNIINLTANRATSVLAVNEVSFSVEKGEIFGIYGANGAGKTTLIKLLSGLLHPTSGTVELDGHTDNRHIKDTVSYISTNGWMGLEWQLTARENLILYGNMFGLSGKTLARRCDEVLLAVGMMEDKDKFISQLSAGMRQKITIARGLILDRPVIFYDEPSVSLDVQSARSLRTLIQADASTHRRTAIIASHKHEDIAICGRIMLLSKGEVIAIGTMDELMNPLSDVELITIHCLNQSCESGLEAIPGIENVTYSSIEGKRDVQIITVSARKGDFSFNRLVDFFIENSITLLSIEPKELSIQEVYEYYVSRKGA
jgi:ABC-2 type transport system ATP-binding protein